MTGEDNVDHCRNCDTLALSNTRENFEDLGRLYLREGLALRALKIGCGTIIGIFAVLFVLAALFGERPPRRGQVQSPRPPAAQPAAVQQPGFVSRAEFGDRWPLTVESGTLRCESNYGTAVVIVVGNVKYALNGRARGQIEQTGWRDSRELVRKDAQSGGLANVGPLIDRGLALCK